MSCNVQLRRAAIENGIHSNMSGRLLHPPAVCDEVAAFDHSSKPEIST
jgi:hypothetical protein